jgi:hypothetical protein
MDSEGFIPASSLKRQTRQNTAAARGKGSESAQDSESTQDSGRGRGTEKNSGRGRGKGSESAQDSGRGKGRGSESAQDSGRGRGSESAQGLGTGRGRGKGKGRDSDIQPSATARAAQERATAKAAQERAREAEVAPAAEVAEVAPAAEVAPTAPPPTPTPTPPPSAKKGWDLKGTETKAQEKAEETKQKEKKMEERLKAEEESIEPGLDVDALNKLVDVRFKLDYVKLTDVNFSQDRVTIDIDFNKTFKTTFRTLNDARCNIPRIKLVYKDGDIYIIGFFGKENPNKKDPERYPPQFPLIEVVDYGKEHPYVTINNRRLVHIHRFLYSIATMEPETRTTKKIRSDLELCNIHDLEDMYKAWFQRNGIIVDNIYIPVIICGSAEIKYNDGMTYADFITDRLLTIKSFCKKRIKRIGNQKWGYCTDFEPQFSHGAPIIPKNGTSDANSMYDIEQIPQLNKQRKMPKPIKPFDNNSKKPLTYNEMLRILFGIESKKKRCSYTSDTKDDVKKSLDNICRCYTEAEKIDSASFVPLGATAAATAATAAAAATASAAAAADPATSAALLSDMPTPVPLIPNEDKELSAKGRVKRTKKRKQCRKGTKRNKRTRRCKKHKMKRTLKR